MDKIKIMEASVRKWERIIAGKSADGGVYDCPPCRIFYVLICIGCPIAEYTGKKFCKGSPYPDWYWHHINAHDKIRRKVYCDECLRLATEMRDFMIEVVEYLKEKKARKEREKQEKKDLGRGKGQGERAEEGQGAEGQGARAEG